MTSPAADAPGVLPAPAPLVRPGQRIDDFVVEEMLHQGGMATIWGVRRVADDPQEGDHAGCPAVDEDDALPLVMKVPRIQGGDDPAAIVGFEVEQMILPMLQGPHVPRFVARGDFTRMPYIVMERIEGSSLRPRLAAAPLPIDEVIEIGARVAIALHELHRQGLVHLDVKPSNIMFRADGSAVLIDFGLSRHDQLPDLLDEAFGLPLGTSPYMAPEQVRHVRDDPRSDLFALAVMLYHFTTGQRPFGQPDTVRGLRRRLFEDPVPPRQLRPDCPPWLQEVILHGLEVDPVQRLQTGAQMALALRFPAQVALTARAAKGRVDSRWRRLKRRLRSLNEKVPRTRASPAAASRLRRSPIVVAAIDVENAGSGLLEHLRETVRRIVLTEPGARLVCVSVLRSSRLATDSRLDEQGRSRHVRQRVALRHWVRPLLQSLALDEGRVSVHVLEAPEPAAAIIDFAARAQADHIVMGARGASALRRHFGSVSSEVVARANCSVTVVRE